MVQSSSCKRNSTFRGIAGQTGYLTIFNSGFATPRPRFLVISFPAIPAAYFAFTFHANLADTFTPSENCHSLIVSEEPLVVL
jgi:hypothetical protein